MTTKSLSFDGTNYLLTMNNDSISMSINLRTTRDIGSFPISASLTSASYFGVNYPDQTDGTYAISHYNVQDNLMSGFYQIKFSRPGFTDTIRVNDGVFEFFQY